MSVYKVIEVIGTSATSWEDAVDGGGQGRRPCATSGWQRS